MKKVILLAFIAVVAILAIELSINSVYASEVPDAPPLGCCTMPTANFRCGDNSIISDQCGKVPLPNCIVECYCITSEGLSYVIAHFC